MEKCLILLLLLLFKKYKLIQISNMYWNFKGFETQYYLKGVSVRGYIDIEGKWKPNIFLTSQNYYSTENHTRIQTQKNGDP